MPILPFLWMKPGIMPTLHSSEVIMPGQFGPKSLHSLFFIAAFTLTISLTGIPSVIQTISFIPASAASIMASAANGAGT